MKILDRLPVAHQHYQYNFRGESSAIKPYQIIIQVSISDHATWDPRIPVFPALLDTGNNHNFSIQAYQLRRWAGIDPDTSRLRVRSAWTDESHSTSCPRMDSPKWRRKRELRGGQPFMLRLAEGVIVYPADGSNHRLYSGSRAIMDNNLSSPSMANAITSRSARRSGEGAYPRGLHEASSPERLG